MKKTLALLASALLCGFGATAFAATITWSGATDNDWFTTTNWDGGVVPGATSGTTSTDIALFNTSPSSLAPTWSGYLNLGGFTFDTGAGSYTIGTTSGSSAFLSSGATTQLKSGVTAAQVINAPLVIANASGGGSGSYTFQNSATSSAATLTLGGAISGQATSGSTTVITFNTIQSGTISGIVSDGSGGGKLSLTKSGAGALTLTGSNSYTGATTISSGTLKMGNLSAIPAASTLAVNGGVFDLNGNDFTTNSLANGNAAGTITDNSAVSGTSTFTLSGTTTIPALATVLADGANGRLLAVAILNNNNGGGYLNNINNTFSGGLTIGGTISTRLAYTANGIGSAGNITSSQLGRGTVTIGQSSTDKAQLNVSPNLTVLNDIVFNSAVGTDIGSAVRVGGTNIILAGKLTAGLADINFAEGNGPGSATLQGQLTGSNGLWVKNGWGSTLTVTLSNTTASLNNYLGNTTVDSRHTLILGAANQIPSGAGYGNMVLSGSLNLGGYSTALNSLTGSGVLEAGGGTPVLTIGATGLTGTFAGTLQNATGSLSLTKAGTGSLTLTKANTYTGTTTVSGGALIAGIANAFGSSAPLALNSGTVNLNGFDQTVGALSGSAGTLITTSAAAATKTLTISFASGTSTFAGVIADNSPGLVALNKSGAGTQVLSGSNSFTGLTTISAGTLALSGSGSLSASGAVTVGNGATFDLGGNSRTTTGVVTLSNGSTLQNGTLTSNNAAEANNGQFAGSITLGSGGAFVTNQRLLLANGGSGSLTIAAGSSGSITFGGDNGSFMNYVGVTSGTGTLTINGGTVNFNNSTYGTGNGYLNVGSNSNTSSGTVTVNGGNLNVGTWMKLGGNYNTAAGTGATSSLSITNGTVSVGGGSDTVTNGVLFMNGATGNDVANTGTATLTVGSGGILNVAQIQAGNGGIKTININGGKIAATGASASLLPAATGLSVNIQAGGATIDTGASSTTVAVPLSGTSGGSLIKAGSGTLTLSSSSSYNGATIVDGGVLSLGIPSDAVIRYDFNSASVSGSTLTNLGTAKDAAGNSGSAFNGGIGSGVTFTSGRDGNAAQFTGAAGINNGIITSGSVSLGQSFTYSTWLSTTAVQSGYERIISNGYQNGGYFGTGGNGTKYLGIVAGVALNNDTTQTVDTSGTWHQLTMVVTSGTYTIYYDGTNAGSWTCTTAARNALMGFGVGVPANDGGNGWNGKMDNAFVFNRALSSTEVTAMAGLATNILPVTTDLQISSSGTLDLGGVNQQVNSLADRNGSGGVITNNGATSSILTVAGTTSNSFSGTFKDGLAAVGLTKSGQSTFTLTGSNNSYTGLTTITSGTLEIGATGRLGGGTHAGNIINNAAFTYSGINNQVFSGVISGTGSLTQNASSTLSLTGSNTYTGPTIVSVGTLQVGNGGTAGSLSGSSAISVASGATLAFNRTDNYGGPVANPISGAGGVLLRSGTLALSATSSYGGSTIVDGGVLNLGGMPSDAVIRYNFNSASVSGSTLLNLGTAVDAAGNSGSAFNGVIASGVTFTSGKEGNAAQFTGGNGIITSGSVSLGKSFTYSTWLSTTSAQVNYGRIISNAYGAGGYLGLSGSGSTFAGIVAGYGLSNGSTQTVDTSGAFHLLTLVATSGSFTLYYDGVSVETLACTSAARNALMGFGSTSADGGTGWIGKMDSTSVFNRALSAAEVRAMVGGAANLLPTTTDLLISGSGTLDLGGASQQVNSLADRNGAGGIVTNSGAAPSTLTVSGTTSSSFSGALKDGFSSLALTKSGSSTLTLSGSSNYTGATTVSGTGSRLIVSGSLVGTTSLSVSAGAELKVNGRVNTASSMTLAGTLSGSGTVGAVTVQSGGILSPGNSPGTLTTGSLALNAGGSYKLELNATTGTAGTNWDQVAASTLDLSGLSSSNKFTLTLQTLTSGNASGALEGFNPAANYTWGGVITFGSLVGTFSSDRFTIDTTGFLNTFNGSFSLVRNGNQLDLQYLAIPEPSVVASLVSGLGMLVFLQRRRR